MGIPSSLKKARGRGARESRRLLSKNRAVYANADSKLPELQPIWQDSANSLPRAPTMSALNFLIGESPVSSLVRLVLYDDRLPNLTQIRDRRSGENQIRCDDPQL